MNEENEFTIYFVFVLLFYIRAIPILYNFWVFWVTLGYSENSNYLAVRIKL